MPEKNPYASAWPPKTPPSYGGQTGSSLWSFDREGRLCIATTIKDDKAWHNFVFYQWGMTACGQSKINHMAKEDNGYLVIDQSNL